MAGNLPIQIPYKLGQQPMLPQAGMPNMTLPPLKLPDIPLEQTSIFTSNPIIDVTKIPEDNILSSVFGQTELKQPPITITPKRVITDEELEKGKIKIRKMLRTCDCEDETEKNILDSITKDNLELAKMLCKDKKFTNYHNIWRITHILNTTNADNIELAKFICRDENFTDVGEIRDILKATNADNIELTKIICTDKRFTSRDNIKEIKSILIATNADNIELAKFLCQDEEFTIMFYNITEIKDILKVTNADNIELAKFLCQNEKFTIIHNIAEIKDILKETNADNIELAKFLCQDEKFTNDCNMRKIPGILSSINKDNIELAKILCRNEKFTNKDNISRISYILEKTNADNIELAKILCKDEKFTYGDNVWELIDILKKTNADNIELAKIICTDERFTNRDNIKEIKHILIATNADNIELAKILCESVTPDDDIGRINNVLFSIDDNNIELATKVIKNKYIPVQVMGSVIVKEYYKDYIDTDVFEKIDNYKHTILQNPELYMNGEVTYYSKKIIKNFVEKNYASLVRAFDIFDKETIDNLMRRRLDNAKEYLDIIDEFDESELELLKKMVNCNNMSDKPLLPSQKVECIDIIQTFKDNNILLSSVIENSIVDNKIIDIIQTFKDNNILLSSVIENSIVYNKIDLGKIKLNLFKMILINCGMKKKQIESIPKEKLLSWDLSYMHLLPKSMYEDEEAFIDLLEGANSDDFIEYIHNTNNDYGEANLATKTEFKKLKMNYEKWLHPDKELETTFTAKDKNSELLSQLAVSISDDIKELRENSAIKRFFDKQFEKYIEKDEFKIPQETINSKANLTELINNIIEQLKPVWERAKKNKDNPQKQDIAGKTLTLLSHLKTKLESLQKMSDIKIEKPFDIRIKMWDRNPQKDLFQGNFSTCCIGMGEVNGKAMPHYLMNTAFNMIELVDSTSGKTIGNALCYFVQDKNDKPIFVIDNIEINNSQKPSKKTGIELRDKMFEYAKNVAKSLTGKDTDVIMSGKYNDVSLEGLCSETKSLKLIGDVDCEKIYMDLFGGWREWKKFEEVNFYGK